MPSSIFLRCVGRIAFPIFAFLISEGIRHTKDIQKYMLRMVAFAIISEIPFNLMVNHTIIDLNHQNVLWTFLLALITINLNRQLKDLCSPTLYTFLSALVMIVGYHLGEQLHVDYGGEGVLTVYAFYYFKNFKLLQLLSLFYIHTHMLSSYRIPLFNFYVPIQSLALISLVFIWLYNNKQGIKNKPFQYFCYGFYPVHMLILALL